MNFIIRLLLITTLIISFSSQAFAQTSLESLMEKKSLNNSKEKFQVQNSLSKGGQKPTEFLVEYKDDLGREELKDIGSPTELNFGEAYKVVIPDKNFVLSLIEGKDIKNSLDDKAYFWEFPILKKNNVPVASCTVVYHDNKWQVAEVGGFLSPKFSLLSSNPKDLARLFTDNNIQGLTNFEHIRISPLHMDVLFLATDNKEYFIPLIHGKQKQEHFGLKNKQLYTRDEFVAAVGPTLKAGLERNPEIEGGVSQEVNRASKGKTVLPMALITICLCFVGFIGYRKLNALE